VKLTAETEPWYDIKGWISSARVDSCITRYLQSFLEIKRDDSSVTRLRVSKAKQRE
jgi:hypothetical protein